MPDNDIYRIHKYVFNAAGNLNVLKYQPTVNDNNRGYYDDLLDRVRADLSAAIDLLDNDRQPVDGSPPDAADPA